MNYSSFLIRETSCIFAEDFCPGWGCFYYIMASVSNSYLFLDYKHHTSCNQWNRRKPLMRCPVLKWYYIIHLSFFLPLFRWNQGGQPPLFEVASSFTIILILLKQSVSGTLNRDAGYDLPAIYDELLSHDRPCGHVTSGTASVR